MTCIVGVEHQGRVWIGGDSAGVSYYDLTVRADAKVFTAGPFVMGFTTSFRMGQLLRYSLDVPAHGPRVGDERYMATVFIDAVRACLRDGGWAKKEHEQESGGVFLVGYRGRLYEVESDYQVGRAQRGFAAVGCAAPFAIGHLYATNTGDRHPRDRIRAALRTAEACSAGVRGPFRIIAEPQ